MGGLSPHEKFKEVYGYDPEEVPDPLKSDGEREGDGPIIKIGDLELSSDEFEELMEEIEIKQEPFRRKFEEEILPAYEIYLKERYKENTVDKHLRVAFTFIRNAFFSGFVEYEMIDEEFAFEEFPIWWQSHVVGKSLSPREVRNSLKKFVKYVEEFYSIHLDDGSDDDVIPSPFFDA